MLVLKSPSVDVEDFDRVVGAGAGELHPGVLLLSFPLAAILSTRPVVLVTYSAGPRPPAEPLHCQSVALSARVHVMKGKNETTLDDGPTRQSVLLEHKTQDNPVRVSNKSVVMSTTEA